MGILDKIRGQLIDVIEWTDSSNKTMVHKYDMNGKEIMMGAQLTVRESQVAPISSSQAVMNCKPATCRFLPH